MIRPFGHSNRPFAGSGHMARKNYIGTQITQWDFQNKGRSGQTGTSSFILEIPLCNLRPSVIYSVPCDRILQRAYPPSKTEEFEIARSLFSCEQKIFSVKCFQKHLSHDNNGISLTEISSNANTLSTLQQTVHCIGETKRRLKDRLNEHRRPVDRPPLPPDPLQFQSISFLTIILPTAQNWYHQNSYIHLDRDALRKAREAYLIERGQTLETKVINKREEIYSYKCSIHLYLMYYIPFYYFVLISLFQRSTFNCIPFLLSCHLLSL